MSMSPKPAVDIRLDKTAIKLLIRAVTKYGDKKVFGSPLEQESFNEVQWQLHTALFELQFKDNC